MTSSGIQTFKPTKTPTIPPQIHPNMSPNKSSPTNPRNQQRENEEETDTENLESEIEQMAQKIKVLRSKTPHQLKSALTSLLAAQRPVFDSGPGRDSGLVESDGSVEDQVTNEKAASLKRKISSNISSMALLMERLSKCISKLDTLNSHDAIVPPAFKKRTT